MNYRARLDSLYEELFHLDEVAGELDDEANQRTDQRRKEILAEMRKLEGSLEFHCRYA